MDLENIKIKHPFTVPEEYFLDMEERINAEIKISELRNLSVPATPDSYFTALEDQIIASVNIEAAAQINRLPVPESYFDEMEHLISAKIKIQNLPQPVVEDDYFRNMEYQISNRIKLEKLTNIRESVPQSYFEDLEQKILAATADKKQGKFTLFRNVTVFRSAAAVVLIGFVSYGLSLFKTEPENEFANISSAAMIAYLGEEPLMEEDLNFVLEEDNNFMFANEVSDNEISAYLLENGITI